MYGHTRQSGRTRVNKVVEGKKFKKRTTQPTKDRSTPLTKLYGVQDELFKDGYSLKEYGNYIQDKINKDKFYYTRITESDVQTLKDRYARLITKEDQHYNELEDVKEMKRTQRKRFREKKREILCARRQELIHDFMKEFTRTSLSKSFNHVMTKLDSKEYYYNVANWHITKKILFGCGGYYLIDTDRKWSSIYNLLVNRPSCNLVDCMNDKELNQYVFEHS